MTHIRREVKLALTAIAAVIILIWGINFLKARALFDRNNVFYGVFERVDGLKISSSVIYRGYSVGQVTAINFTGERFDKVLVQFTVGKNLEIPSNSVAAIQSSDLMGSKSINLIPGNSATYAESGDTLRSQLELGLVEQLNEQLEPLKQKAENVMVSLDSVLLALQEIFSGDTDGNIRNSLKSVSNTFDNVEKASGTLNSLIGKESEVISDILENINSITSNLEGNNSKINGSLHNISSFSDSLKTIDLNNTVRLLNRVLSQADSIVIKINQGQGTLGNIVNDNELYYNLNAVSENLDKLLTEFRQNPKRFINLSVFDFSSGKNMEQNGYAIVIAQNDRPMAPDAELYLQYPYLKEIRRNGKFLYFSRIYRKLNQAEKELENVKKDFKDAFIVKID